MSGMNRGSSPFLSHHRFSKIYQIPGLSSTTPKGGRSDESFETSAWINSGRHSLSTTSGRSFRVISSFGEFHSRRPESGQNTYAPTWGAFFKPFFFFFIYTGLLQSSRPPTTTTTTTRPLLSIYVWRHDATLKNKKFDIPSPYVDVCTNTTAPHNPDVDTKRWKMCGDTTPLFSKYFLFCFVFFFYTPNSLFLFVPWYQQLAKNSGVNVPIIIPE